MFTSQKQSAILSKQAVNTVYNGPTHVLMRQYISDPIFGQTITGTVKGQIYSAESISDTDACSEVAIRVLSGDGATVRGTLLAGFRGALANEFPAGTFASTGTNRYFPASVAVSSVAAETGDRIVIELGGAIYKGSGSARYLQLWLGDDEVEDAPEDETDTNFPTKNPWIEFSQSIIFGRPSLLGVE